jgi:two-component system, chemotaxis family, chemotaxis protein CheY
MFPTGELRAIMKRVLVVDDSPMVRELVRSTLEGGGFEAVEASDGGDALAKLESDAEIALVISDVNMPVMGGLDFLDRFVSSGRHKTIPFVLLTSEAMPSMIERAKKAGAKGWIVKPFKPLLLLAAVRKLLG